MIKFSKGGKGGANIAVEMKGEGSAGPFNYVLLSEKANMTAVIFYFIHLLLAHPNFMGEAIMSLERSIPLIERK